MNRSLAWPPLIALALMCGCGSSAVRSLPKGEAVLNISISEKQGLLVKLGFTNIPAAAQLWHSIALRRQAS